MITDFRKKQKRSSLKPLLILCGGILIFLLIILLVVANVRIYQKKKALALQIEALKNKIENTKNRSDELKEGIAKTDNEQYIEKIAREELDLQKPGEKVFSFVKSPSQEKEDGRNKSFIKVWLGWLGGLFKK